MSSRGLRFASLFFVALALMASGAHLLALPNKIDLSGPDYLIVQQIYRGWAWLGIVIAGAIVTIALAAWSARDRNDVFQPTLLALALILGTQALFWIFNFPANQDTHNWTTLPSHWESLRRQWEYAHAGSALLTLGAMAALVHAVVRGESTAANSSRPAGAAVGRTRGYHDLEEVEA